MNHINSKNKERIDETKRAIKNYMGKAITKFSIREPTYRLSIDDFDSRGDYVF